MLVKWAPWFPGAIVDCKSMTLVIVGIVWLWMLRLDYVWSSLSMKLILFERQFDIYVAIQRLPVMNNDPFIYPPVYFDSEWLWCNFIMKNRPDIMYGKCDNVQTKIKLFVSSDVIRRHWPWITLVRAMAWFLTATIHWHIHGFTCQLKLLFLKDR